MNKLPYTNLIFLKSKNVKAVCQFCGKKSKPVPLAKNGEADCFELSIGWAVVPYPTSFLHSDGSVGSMYTCPSCNKLLKSGSGRKLRDYLV